MRYWEIIESRRNPEQNPKVSTLEALEKYAGRDDVFVSFTSDVGKMSHEFSGKNISGSKLGINPKSTYKTPIGIYTYPIDHVLDKKVRVEWADDAPFLYVVQAMKPLLDIANYSEEDFERDSKKLIDMGFEDSQEYGIEFAKFDTPAAWLWNWTREATLKSPKPAVQWSKLFRSLGYSGAYDFEGEGLIHHNEPIQAVFFSKDAIKVLEVINNKPSDLGKVERDWTKIHNIKNPSEQVQIAAINQHPYAFEVILKKGIIPSEQVQLAVVRENGYSIRFIIEKGITPSEQVQLAAVTKNGSVIEYIKNPSEAVKLAAVNGYGYAIKYINNPSEEVQLAAVRQAGRVIRYIIEKGITPSEQVQLAAVTQNKNAIEYIKNPSDAVKKAAGL